jgi:hypothetical protein
MKSVLISIVVSVLVTGCIWSKRITEDAPPPAIVTQEQWEECISVKSKSDWDEKQCSGNWPVYW